LGAKMSALRNSSRSFLDNWHRQFIDGAPVTQYKKTDTDWAKVLRKQDQREHVQKMVGEVFRRERKAPYQMMFTTDEDFAECSLVDQRLQVLHPMKMILAGSSEFPAFNLELEFTVVSTGPIDMAAPPDTPISWEIRKIRVTRAAPAPKMSGPG